MKDFVIIVQGSSLYVERLKQSLYGFNVIYSTWIGEENKFSEADIVIFNDLPNFYGPANLNLQKITTMSGLRKAKEMGYKKALKLRSDIIPTNMNKFVDCLDNDAINFLCWHLHEVYPGCPGYLVDYLMSGSVDDLLELWNIQDMSWCSVPEVFLTQQYILKLIHTTKIEYFLPFLDETNDLHWLKNNIKLSSYKENYIYDRYRKYDFGLNKEFLINEYTKFLK
jgi:hypothetical protein